MNHNIYNHFGLNSCNLAPLVFDESGRVFTYADIHERVGQFCHFFNSIGLKQADRVLQQTEKSVDALCVYLSCLCFGLIYIPLNPSFQKEELTFFIEDAMPSLFICMDQNFSDIQNILQCKKIICVLETLLENGKGSLQIKSAAFHQDFNVAAKNGDDTACILYTSGTTGKPKGAMLSHQNLLSNGQALAKTWGFTRKDIVLHMLPIFHCHGLFFACHCILLSGASMFLISKFDTELALQFLPDSSVFMGVPTYYTRLLSDSRFNKKIARNIRLFISGSAPLLEKTFYAFKDRLGQPILERYGMTETGINTSNPLKGFRMPSSVGQSLPGVQLRIVDDNDQCLPLNTSGHIQIKGEHVFSNYWKKEAIHFEFFTEDGYFRTGDIGKISTAGYVYIVGRAKDMIITGGLNVYPSELETLLDKIEGVKESAVIGLPHPDLGEAVTAIVAVQNAEAICIEEIIQFIKRSLAHYKAPKKVLFVETLPKNAMGKVQKNILRERYSHLYTAPKWQAPATPKP